MQELVQLTWVFKQELFDAMFIIFNAKNSSKLNKFLQSEVNQLIQDIIVQDQDGENNNILIFATEAIPSIISFSKDWCALITCPKYRIFSVFVMASNEMFGLTFCKMSLFVFLSVHDTFRI